MIDVPYSENKSKNEDKFPSRGSNYPCLLCGRPVKQEVAPYVRVHNGGLSVVTNAEAEELNARGEEGGDMLCFPIGPDCWKKHPELHQYQQGKP